MHSSKDQNAQRNPLQPKRVKADVQALRFDFLDVAVRADDKGPCIESAASLRCQTDFHRVNEAVKF